MNTISSRTPEGEPNKCPVCGNEVVVEPSLWFGDAPCPNCGHLLWFFRTQREAFFIEHDAALPLRNRIAAMAARQSESGQIALPGKPAAIGQSQSVRVALPANQGSIGLAIVVFGFLALACLAIGHARLNADTVMTGGVGSLAICFVGTVVWFMHWTENRLRSFPAPSLEISKLLVATVPVVFWVPVFGLIVTSVAIDRAYWLVLPDWISSCLAACFFVAATITLGTLAVFSCCLFLPF